MAIQGNPTAMMTMGGKRATGGLAEGIYRVIVQDAALGTANTGRPYVELTFFGKGDNEHPEKDGKKVVSMRMYGIIDDDDEKKADTMRGIMGRKTDGLGIKWGDEAKPLDARIFVKREAFIVVANKESTDGKSFPEVVAIAQKKEELRMPKAKVDTNVAASSNAKATSKPTTNARR